MKNLTYITVDLETTGLAMERNGICEIGAVATDSDGALLDVFQSYANPSDLYEVEIDASALEVNGMTAVQIMASPDLHAKVIPSFSRWIKTFIPEKVKDGEEPEVRFVAHCAKFDIPPLEKEFRTTKRHGMLEGLPDSGVFRRVLCTVSLAFPLDPSAGLMSLKKLCARYGVTNHRPHGALTDAIATSNVFHAILREHEHRRQMVTSFSSPTYISQPSPYVLPYGSIPGVMDSPSVLRYGDQQINTAGDVVHG